jgi:transcriptional regulator
MYIPAHFREERTEALYELIRVFPLATLVTTGPEGPIANHVPLIADEGRLLGHLARGNPQWRDSKGEALAIFTGPQHYISPNWYPSKAEHGRVVPTWNYVAVHAYGKLVVHDDPVWLRALVTRLTDMHEAQFAQPWAVSDAPADYIDGMLKAIVGIEIRIERLEGKWKLGQNRPAEDRAGTVEGLQKTESPSAARLGELMANLEKRT